MRTLQIVVALAALVAIAAGPAAAQQQPVKGKEAVAIVKDGQIRSSSSQGFQGFLFLIEYQGNQYMCAVKANGQVQSCFPLYW